MGKRALIASLLLLLSGCGTIHHLLPWHDDADTAEQATQQATPRLTPPEIVWRRNLDYLPLGGVHAFSQPAVIKLRDGHLAVAAGGEDRFVHILDLATGSELHRIAVDEAVESGTLQLANGLVVVGDITGNLYGIDPDNGVIGWRMRLSTLLLGRPVPIGNDFLLQTMDNRIYRISANGHKIWSFDGYPGGISMHATPSPLVDSDHHRVLTVLSTGDVLALNADNGDLLWRKQLLLNADAAVLSEMKAPVADVVRVPDLRYGVDHLASALLVPFYQGDLRLLDADRGEQRASRTLSLRASPLLVDHTLLLADSSGTLRAIDTASGDTRWKVALSDHELTGVARWQRQLWVSDNGGHLYRLTSSGHRLGAITLPGSINRAPIPTPSGVIVRTSRGGIYLIH